MTKKPKDQETSLENDNYVKMLKILCTYCWPQLGMIPSKFRTTFSFVKYRTVAPTELKMF